MQNTSADTQVFKPIPRQATLTSHVVTELEVFITDRHLQSGDRIPPERELAAQFGVSRTVIREAVSRLVAKGLLEVSAGSGTIVSRPTMESVARSMSLCLGAEKAVLDYAQIHEIRRVLEVEIAGFAAERRTTQDLETLRSLLDEAAAAGTQDRARYVEADIAFHTALAQATHNSLFSLLLDSLSDIMLDIRERGFDIPDTPARALKHHRAIFEQVERRDVVGTRLAMHADLIEAEKIQSELRNQE